MVQYAGRFVTNSVVQGGNIGDNNRGRAKSKGGYANKQRVVVARHKHKVAERYADGVALHHKEAAHHISQVQVVCSRSRVAGVGNGHRVGNQVHSITSDVGLASDTGHS